MIDLGKSQGSSGVFMKTHVTTFLRNRLHPHGKGRDAFHAFATKIISISAMIAFWSVVLISADFNAELFSRKEAV